MGKWRRRGQLGPRSRKHWWTDVDRRCEEKCRESIRFKLRFSPHDTIDILYTYHQRPHWIIFYGLLHCFALDYYYNEGKQKCEGNSGLKMK